MDAAVAWAARIVLALVLTSAAIGKFRSRDELPHQLEVLGVPPGAVGGAAVVLPLTEVAIAVGLVAAPRSSIPAWVALALLAAFTVVVAATLARGVRTACACFGASSAAPMSSRTLLRNAWLLALAVLGTGTTTDATGWGILGAVAVLGVVTVVVLGRFG